jgi:hypothetical protein
MKDLYSDYKLIRKMKVNLKTKARILSELMATAPETWRVFGITEEALKVFHDYNFKKGIRMRINRSHHPKGRTDFYLEMLTAPLTTYEQWWQDYYAFDKTILATATENNKNNFSKIFEIDSKLGLFKAQGYAWKHNAKESDFLRKIYNEKINELQSGHPVKT